MLTSPCETPIPDILARISLSFLSSCSPAFAPLLAPQLTPQTIPDTLLVVLLDWNEPWLWLRQLRCWLQLVQRVLRSLSDACKETMEEVMARWSVRGRDKSRCHEKSQKHKKPASFLH